MLINDYLNSYEFNQIDRNISSKNGGLNRQGRLS